jgi:hypothetical protein
VIASLEVMVAEKFTAKGAQPFFGRPLIETWGWAMFIYCERVNVSEHPDVLVLTNVTVYAPGALYTCVGFTSEDVVPSPKCQSVVVASELAFAKETDKGTWHADTGVAVNADTGLGDIVIVLVVESMQAPKLLTSLIEYVPGVV